MSVERWRAFGSRRVASCFAVLFFATTPVWRWHHNGYQGSSSAASSYQIALHWSDPAPVAPQWWSSLPVSRSRQSTISPTRSDGRFGSDRILPRDTCGIARSGWRGARAYFVDHLWGLAILFGALLLHLGPKYRDVAERLSARRFVQVLFYVPAVMLTLAVFRVPAHVWNYEITCPGPIRATWGRALGDYREGVAVAVGTILIWILYAVTRHSMRRWWLYVWLASILSLLARIWLPPLLFSSVFSRPEPIEARYPELAAAMQQVMRHGHADVPPGRILEDGPASLSEFGGYVAGVGPWKHIVLRRGTVERNTGSEALWTFGHELGHYALFHPEKELATDALVLFLFMCTAGRMTTWLLARWGPRWGLRGIDDLATLPLLLLLIGGVTFIEAPALNLTRRHQEHEADRYAVEVTHGIVPDPGRAAVLSLQDAEGVDSLNRDPSPFAQFWLQTHPTTADRIRFVTTYDPWSAGGKPTYVR